MFSLINQTELRKVTISSLITCIYLPSIIVLVSYKGLLYSVGNASSLYILVLIFIAEFLKSFYLNSADDLQNRKIKPHKYSAGDVASSIVFLLCTTICFFVGIILFGAPALEFHEETLMLSALLTLLAVLPLILHSGVESSMQLVFGVKQFGKDSIVEMHVNNALFTVCGAWLGAVVIPLDWNMPWQVWPIPCYLGAINGYILSNVINILRVMLMSAANKYPTLNLLVGVLNKLKVSK